jgi:hypothetical protein
VASRVVLSSIQLLGLYYSGLRSQQSFIFSFYSLTTYLGLKFYSFHSTHSLHVLGRTGPKQIVSEQNEKNKTLLRLTATIIVLMTKTQQDATHKNKKKIHTVSPFTLEH